MTLTIDPFDLIKRLGTVPMESLVDVLRDLHREGAVDSKHLRALISEQAAPPSRPALLRPEAPRSSASDYEQARRHFVEHAQRLREQAMLAERLLEGLSRHGDRAMEAALQRELRVECMPRSTSGARFVVTNCLDHEVNVRLQLGRPHGSQMSDASEMISFEPETFRLEPAAEELVRLLVDLRGYDGPSGVIEVGVDVFGDDRLLLKLWVRVEVRGEEVASGA